MCWTSITLCGRRPLASHTGALVIDGTASTGFGFRHADGTPDGEDVPPEAIDTPHRVRSALIHMGFREREDRALIDRVLEQGAPDDITAFLRAALRAA